MYFSKNVQMIFICLTNRLHSLCFQDSLQSYRYYICLDTNECNFNPCQNNGTCVNSMGSYTCDCIDGWEDQNCEKGKCFDS